MNHRKPALHQESRNRLVTLDSSSIYHGEAGSELVVPKKGGIFRIAGTSTPHGGNELTETFNLPSGYWTSTLKTAHFYWKLRFMLI